ncbi:hypothetical protein K1719_014305 [Acacia pycnantha]|nr:hypothetical protein K1719_014305 [Acacia pycnantha]
MEVIRRRTSDRAGAWWVWVSEGGGIDNQAAEPVHKNESLPYVEPRIDSPARTSGAVSLKDHLKEKAPEDGNYLGKLHSDPNFSPINDGHKDSTSAPKTSPKSSTAITDGDWTQLLSIPNPFTASRSNHSTIIE